MIALAGFFGLILGFVLGLAFGELLARPSAYVYRDMIDRQRDAEPPDPRPHRSDW